MRTPTMIVLLALTAGCSPEHSVSGSARDVTGNARVVTGNADVVGQVIQSSGLPLANSSVVVDCAAGAVRSNAATDSAGRYHVNLTSPSPGSLHCVFGVPDLVTSRIRVDTVIGFSRTGQLHALQFLDLYESAR